MTSRDFCYWLQGFIEVGQPHIVTQEQLATIRAHLAMVFHHEIDPSHGSIQHVEELRKIHEGKTTAHLSGEDKPLAPREQFPDGAPVTLPKSLVDVLPKDWPLEVKMNC